MVSYFLIDEHEGEMFALVMYSLFSFVFYSLLMICRLKGIFIAFSRIKLLLFGSLSCESLSECSIRLQIWMHADQSRSGFLGRQEFYNFLKLVTVVQSKRELTPDIVKAALYGPASAKIPAPQINLPATPNPQVSSRPTTPSTQVNAMPPTSSQSQMGVVPPMSAQNFGFRGQVPPNPGMNQQYFPPQGNQTMRPPVPAPSGNASRPFQGVTGPNFPQGGGIPGTSVSSSSLSTDWLGGRAAGSPSGATSQVAQRGISSYIPSVVQKPSDSLSVSSPAAASSPNSFVGPGNGFASNSNFGGDMFSVNKSVPNQASASPTYSASNVPASPTVVPVTSGSQPSAKLDPLESLNAFTRSGGGGQPPRPTTQSPVKPSQSNSSQNSNPLGSSGSSADSNSTSGQQQPSWPKMTRAGIQRYHKVFVEVDTDRDGRITGDQARNLFLSWRLPRGNKFCLDMVLWTKLTPS